MQPTPLPEDPCTGQCYGRYHEVHFDTIRCSRTSLATSSFPIDVAAGVTIAGHSTGAESTLYAASIAPTEYRIASAALHHYGRGSRNAQYYIYVPNNPPVPRVPTIMFTGTADGVIVLNEGHPDRILIANASPNETVRVFKHAATSGLPRGLVNKAGEGHCEPCNEAFNPRLGYYSVAWAYLYQNFGAPVARLPAKRAVGVDWERAIYGHGMASVCGGGDGKLAECVMERGPYHEV